MSGITPADLQREPGRPAVFVSARSRRIRRRRKGLLVDAVAEEYTTGGLIAALLRWFAAAHSLPA